MEKLNSMDKNTTTEIRQSGNDTSFSKSWTDKDGLNNRVEVKEVKGGYIIRKSKYGSITKGEKSEYIDENTEEITTENPIEKLRGDKGSKEHSEILSALSELGEETGLIHGI